MYNKYHNIPKFVDGIRFDSSREARRYSELLLLVQAKEITKLELQPEFELLEKFVDFEGKKHQGISYFADFSYVDKINKLVIVEDVKSSLTFKTEVYKIKKKLFLAKYPHLIFREIY